MTRFTLFIGILALTLAACDTTDPVDESRVEANVVADLPADPGVRDQTTGVVNDTGRYTLYSLRDGEVVLSYDEEDRSDSLSTAWDIGFRGTTIIVNGGASGPGNAGAVVLEEAYDDVMAVPASASFRVDGTADVPDGPDAERSRPGALAGGLHRRRQRLVYLRPVPWQHGGLYRPHAWPHASRPHGRWRGLCEGPFRELLPGRARGL